MGARRAVLPGPVAVEPPCGRRRAVRRGGVPRPVRVLQAMPAERRLYNKAFKTKKFKMLDISSSFVFHGC